MGSLLACDFLGLSVSYLLFSCLLANDGAPILEQMDVDNQIAKLMVELSWS